MGITPRTLFLSPMQRLAFYKLADGSLKSISEPTYGDSEVHAVLKQTSIPVWLQRELDEIDYGIFKGKEVIDVPAHSEETR